jgi:hypothetical protein
MVMMAAWAAVGTGLRHQYNLSHALPPCGVVHARAICRKRYRIAMNDRLELSCPNCSYTLVCGPGAMLDWLRQARIVRRGVEPEQELLAELFRTSAGKFTCPECGKTGLQARTVDDGDDEAWGLARRCEGCQQPIDRERLEALPDTRLCTKCQAGDERGAPSGPAEYCAKCGEIMVTRPTRGAGVTRYQTVCPSCRR